VHSGSFDPQEVRAISAGSFLERQVRLNQRRGCIKYKYVTFQTTVH
jgi:hypothetical protein